MEGDKPQETEAVAIESLTTADTLLYLTNFDESPDSQKVALALSHQLVHRTQASLFMIEVRAASIASLH